jgi:hypothetical protein
VALNITIADIVLASNPAPLCRLPSYDVVLVLMGEPASTAHPGHNSTLALDTSINLFYKRQGGGWWAGLDLADE